MSFHFLNVILGQVWCLIVSIPDLCPLSYFTMALVCICKMLHIPCQNGPQDEEDVFINQVMIHFVTSNACALLVDAKVNF